jgi:hypothetical protein
VVQEIRLLKRWTQITMAKSPVKRSKTPLLRWLLWIKTATER